jgi:hypothetical protein
MSEILCHRRLTEITAYVTCAMADFELSWPAVLMDSDGCASPLTQAVRLRCNWNKTALRRMVEAVDDRCRKAYNEEGRRRHITVVDRTLNKT